jgi:hypothetical protein
VIAAALPPLIPEPRESEEYDYFGETKAEKKFHARREELGLPTPCEEMPARNFWADEDTNSELLRESAKMAAKRVLPGILACRTCPLLPECYRMGTEGAPGRDGVFGGEYFNVIATTKRPTKKQDGVRRHVREMLHATTGAKR